MQEQYDRKTFHVTRVCVYLRTDLHVFSMCSADRLKKPGDGFTATNSTVSVLAFKIGLVYQTVIHERWTFHLFTRAGLFQNQLTLY